MTKKNLADKLGLGGHLIVLGLTAMLLTPFIGWVAKPYLNSIWEVYPICLFGACLVILGMIQDGI